MFQIKKGEDNFCISIGSGFFSPPFVWLLRLIPFGLLIGKRDSRTKRANVCLFLLASHDQALYGGWNASCDKYRLFTVLTMCLCVCVGLGKSFLSPYACYGFLCISIKQENVLCLWCCCRWRWCTIINHFRMFLHSFFRVCMCFALRENVFAGCSAIVVRT